MQRRSVGCARNDGNRQTARRSVRSEYNEFLRYRFAVAFLFGRNVLMHVLRLFKDGIGAATAATAPSVGLDVKYENAWHCVAQAATQAKWHNKRNGVSLCLDRVLSPATRSPWVPLQGGTVIGKTPEERGKLHLGG